MSVVIEGNAGCRGGGGAPLPHPESFLSNPALSDSELYSNPFGGQCFVGAVTDSSAFFFSAILFIVHRLFSCSFDHLLYIGFFPSSPSFATLFRLAPLSQLSPTASFTQDLGLDSLDAVEVVMAIEEEFAIEIPDEDADAIESVGQAIEYIAKVCFHVSLPFYQRTSRHPTYLCLSRRY